MIYLWVSLAIGILGILLFIYLVFKKHNLTVKRPKEAIQEYKKAQEKLSKRKDDTEITDSESYGFPLGSIIGGFIVVVVGINLIPTVTDQISEAAALSNVTGAASTLLDITPLLFAIGIIGVAISIAMGALKQSNII